MFSSFTKKYFVSIDVSFNKNLADFSDSLAYTSLQEETMTSQEKSWDVILDMENKTHNIHLSDINIEKPNIESTLLNLF